MTIAVSTIAITASGQYSNPVNIKGIFNFAVYGTFTGTVLLQASFDNGATWINVASHTAPTVDSGIFAPNETILLRAGSASFTDGTANVRISQ